MDQSRVHRETIDRDYHGIITEISRQLFACTYHPLRKCPLFIICMFGLVSVFIDADHIIKEQLGMVRGLHLPVFLLVWIVNISYFTYSYRRVHQHSVTKKECEI